MWEETFSYLGSWHKLYKLSGLWEMPLTGNRIQTQTQRAFPQLKGSVQSLTAGAHWGSLCQGAQALGVFILLIFAKCIDIGEQDLCESWHILTRQSTVFKYLLSSKPEGRKQHPQPQLGSLRSRSQMAILCSAGSGCVLLTVKVCDRGSHIRIAR